MLMAAFLLPFASHAQNSWTVADGTTTHATVPLDFYNCDGSGVRNAQMLYPASLLTDMVGSNIGAITFYHQNTSANKTLSASTWYIMMGTTTETDLSTGFSTVVLDTVYAGNLVVAGGVFTFEFDIPYSYNGGNLIVEIYTTGATGNWFGSSNQGCLGVDSIGSTYSSMSSPNYTSFLPKTTFTEAPSCFPVSNVVVSDVTANSITLTWTDAVNSGAQYSVFDMSGVNPSVIATLINGTTYTLTGLEGNTNYLLGVAANCSETDASTITEITARTACPATIALPYVEEFDGYTGFQTYPYYGPSVLPACWIYWGNGTNTAETSGTSVYYGGVAQYSGTGYGSMESNNPYLYLPIQLTGANVTGSTGLGYATARGDVRYAVLPAFAESLTGLQMSFDYKMSSSYSATGAAAVLELGYVTNDDVTTFVSMWSANAINSIQHVVDLNLTTLAAAAPAGARLAFKFSGVHNGTGTSSYTNVGCGIDNITVETLPACSRALDVTVAAVTTSSVTLNWHHNDLNAANTTYTVYNMADTTVVATGVNDTTYTVTGLTANTVYNFGVEANCAAGDAAITIVSSRTACAAEALPFSETFDASLSSNPCWAGANILYADGVTPTMGANNNWTYTSTASNGIEAGHYRVNIFGTSCNKWLITPEIDLTTATNPMLTFDAAFTVYSSTSTGPATGFENNDSQKFMVLVSTNNGQTWTVASDIPLTSIASGSYLTQYVNLAAHAGETVRVAFYAQSTVSGGDNNLHIDNIAIDEVVGEICYPVTGLAASNITADGATLTWTGDAASYNVYVIAADTTLVQNVATTTLTLTGLTAMTQYTYGVRAVCTSSESDMVSVTFATACSSISLPFTETFEATSATTGCWTTDGPGNWTIGTGDYTAATGAYEGSLNAKITHGTTGDVTKLISPVLSGVTNGLQLTFAHIQRSWAGDIDNLAVYYRTSSDATWQQLVNYTDEVAAWTVETINIPGTVYQVAFEYADNYGYGVGVDSVAFNLPPACMPVGNLTASNITTDGATLTWTGDAASYNVYAVADGATTLVQNVTAATITLTGLTAMTTYTYGVRSVCGTDESDMTTVTFATACGAVAIPYTVNFTDATFACWSMVDVDANTGVDGNQFRFSYNTNPPQYLISPELSGTANGLQVSFLYRVASASYPESFVLGYSTTTNDTSAFTWGIEQTNLTNNTDYEPYSEVMPAGVKYVAIKYTANDMYYLYISDLVLAEPPACAPVTNVVVDSVTATSVTLSWTDTLNTGATYTVYDATGAVVATNIATTSYDVTGLTAATNYTFGVAANCSATETSDVATVTVRTDCSTGSCNITIATTNGYGFLGGSIDVMQNGALVDNVSDGASYEDLTETVSVCSGAPVTLVWNEGELDSYVSFTVQDGGNTVVYTCTSGSTLVDGTVFATIADPCPACLPAADLTVDTATTTSITISWTGTAASYDVYNGETFVANVTTNTYTFTGLNPASTYTFGVQAICSATDTASMATIDAMTACGDITTLPYAEGFENGLGCWNTVNGSADGMPWNAVDNASYAHSGTGAAVSFSYYNTSIHANAWLISPKFVLPTIAAGDTLTLSWWHMVSANWPTELYDVMLSTTTDDTAAFTTTLLAVNPDSLSDYVQKTVDLSAYAGQSVYLAFHHHDSYDQNYLFIDDIALTIGAAPVPVPDTVYVTFAVDDSTMGTTVPAPGTYQYLEGDTVYFGSSANPGYHFLMWEVTIGSDVDTFDATYSNGYYILADYLMGESPVIFKAFFEVGNPDSMQVTIAVNDPTMGTTNPAPGVHYYYADQMASLVAIPNPGNHLEGWAYSVTIPGYGTQADTIPFAIDDFFEAFLDGEVLPASFCQYEWTVTALFAAGEPPVMHDSVTVITSVNDATMGTITPAPGTHYYVDGDTVEFNIQPNPGYYVYAIQFTESYMGYSDSETITDTADIAEFIAEMSAEPIIVSDSMYGLTLSINVIFAAEGTAPNIYHVTVGYDVSRGTVTGADDYIEGSTVTLTAMAFSGYEFVAWVENGDTVGRQTVYTIDNIDADHYLTAVFGVSTQGIADVEADNVNVYSTDNVIVVRGAEGKQVVLFDVNGRMLSREARAAENVEFRVNNSGVYLVKVANAAAKRVVVIR